MKRFIFLISCCLLASKIFSLGIQDTLFKKRINFSLNVNLLEPNRSSINRFEGKEIPNSNFYDSKTRSVYYTNVNKTSFDISTSAYIHTFKGLYVETGLRVGVYTSNTFFNGDTLYYNKGTVVDMTKTSDTKILAAATLGLMYKFGKRFFISAGAYINIIDHDYWHASDYYENTKLVSAKGVDRTSSATTKYVYANIKLNKRFYINAGVTKTIWDENDLYYNIGARFFLYSF